MLIRCPGPLIDVQQNAENRSKAFILSQFAVILSMFTVILSAAKDPALSISKTIRDSSSPARPLQKLDA